MSVYFCQAVHVASNYPNSWLQAHTLFSLHKSWDKTRMLYIFFLICWIIMWKNYFCKYLGKFHTFIPNTNKRLIGVVFTHSQWRNEWLAYVFTIQRDIKVSVLKENRAPNQWVHKTRLIFFFSFKTCKNYNWSMSPLLNHDK